MCTQDNGAQPKNFIHWSKKYDGEKNLALMGIRLGKKGAPHRHTAVARVILAFDMEYSCSLRTPSILFYSFSRLHWPKCLVYRSYFFFLFFFFFLRGGVRVLAMWIIISAEISSHVFVLRPVCFVQGLRVIPFKIPFNQVQETSTWRMSLWWSIPYLHWGGRGSRVCIYVDACMCVCVV